MRKHPTDRMESKVKNVRFLGELTKFGICPPKVVLTCLQVLLRLFKGHSLDTACALLESCGRFLYRSADTHVRTKLLLDIMMKKKMALHLDERQIALVDNAFYYCNPPERQALQRKVRPPLHEFLRFLLYKDLSKTTVEGTLRLLRKMPWNDEEFVQYALKCFTRVWW